MSSASTNDLSDPQDLADLDVGSGEFTSQPDIYDAETDIDSEYEEPKVDSKFEIFHLKVLPDFFKNKKFYLGTDILHNIASLLKRYIIAYKG